MDVSKNFFVVFQGWTIRTLNINLIPHRNKTHPQIFQEELEKVKERYPKHSHIFMDGSKLEKITRCPTVHKRKIFKKHVPNNTSIFSAEAYTINIALDHISESRNNKFIIFSHLLSMLESLKNRKFDNPLIIKILCKLENLSNIVSICWVPSHTGISGNDQADKTTRSTLNITCEKNFKYHLQTLKWR